MNLAKIKMSDDATQLSFPLPPSVYYQLYTNDNVSSKAVPGPPKPVEGQYCMFGAEFHTEDAIIQPLEKQGIPRVYSADPKFDHVVEMKKLNHSILVNYLELIDLMIESPSSPERHAKIEEIKVLFINLHHLINEFRPHQARETLRVMLHKQKQQRLETADKLRRHIDKARVLLRGCGGSFGSLLLHLHADTLSTTIKMEVDSLPDQAVEKMSSHVRRNEIMCSFIDGT